MLIDNFILLMIQYALNQKGGVIMTKKNTRKRLFIAKVILLTSFLTLVNVQGIMARQIVFDVPTHPNGALIKTANSDKIYVLDNGFKRFIPSPQIFESRYRWQDVVTISENEMTSYSTGNHILFRDGTLISDKNAVYIVVHGQKRPFASPTTFEMKGYKWENVKKVNDDNTLRIHTTGDALFPHEGRTDGDLIKTANNHNIYLLEDGKKRLIPSPLVFEMRYQWNDIVTISELEMGFYSTGKNISFPDGMLVRGDNTVYVIEDAKKRPMAHSTVFEALNYKWGNVVWPSDYKFVLSLYPTGEMITGD